VAQPLVLAIEPDLRQAAIVKRIVREKALAEIAVVDTRDAAIEAMRTCMPDVLLLSALLSPRDEDELIAHLKTLDNAGHLQTHTIPQLASSLEPGEERASRGLLSAFRRKKDPARLAAGCDPDLFADEIRVFLQRAADKKNQLLSTSFTAPDMRPSATASTRAAAAPADEPADAPSSSWASPFEWKPSGASARAARTPEAPSARVAQPSRTAARPPEPARAAPPPEPPTPSVPLSVVAPDPAPIPDPPAVEPVVAAAAAPAAPAPSVILEKPRAAEPVVHVAARPVTAPQPVAAAPQSAAATKPAAARPAASEPARPKPVADRAAKGATRVQLQSLLKARAAKEPETRDRLGPLARWARTETPRAARTAPVTGEDVRALISSLAVPPAVASVSYPRGCRLRRVRVPVSPDHDGGDGSGSVLLSRRTLAEQREKHSSA
jgi:hypothetical protein